MKAEHTNHTHIPTSFCECSDSQWLVSSRDIARLTAVYESAKIQFSCSVCNSPVSTFYRELELEETSTKANKSVVGQTVQTKRFIAWVGYAKNTKTVFWSYKDEQEKMAAMLAKATDVGIDVAREVLRSDGNYWLVSAARRRARYLLFRQVFTFPPILPIRGLWFMNIELEVTIGGVLRCVTGRRTAGSSGSDFYYSDYDPPVLCNQVHHQLYYGHDKTGQSVMIYPGDVEEKK